MLFQLDLAVRLERTWRIADETDCCERSLSFELKQDPSDNILGGGPNGPRGRQSAAQYQLYDIFVAIRDGPLVQFKVRLTY